VGIDFLCDEFLDVLHLAIVEGGVIAHLVKDFIRFEFEDCVIERLEEGVKISG
jgi:hypothetical protein